MTTSKLAAVLALNLLFFTTVHSSWNTPPPPVPPPPPCPPPPPTPPVSPPPTPTPPVSPPLPPTPPVSPPHPPTPPPPGGSCPINALQLVVCANLLQAAQFNLPVPPGPREQCCSLVDPLISLDAAFCFCTALQLNILGTNLDLTVATTLLVNECGKTCPSDFTCPEL